MNIYFIKKKKDDCNHLVRVPSHPIRTSVSLSNSPAALRPPGNVADHLQALSVHAAASSSPLSLCFLSRLLDAIQSSDVVRAVLAVGPVRSNVDARVGYDRGVVCGHRVGHVGVRRRTPW